MSNKPHGEQDLGTSSYGPEPPNIWYAFLRDHPSGLTVLLSFVRLSAVFQSGELFNPDGTLRNKAAGMNALFEFGMDLSCLRDFAVKYCSTGATEEKLDAFFEFQRKIRPLEDRLSIIVAKIAEQYRVSSNQLPNLDQQSPGLLPHLLRLLNCLKFYEPPFYELLKDFMLEKRECKTKKELKWLAFRFNVRKIVLFLGSLKAMVLDKIERVMAWILNR